MESTEQKTQPKEQKTQPKAQKLLNRKLNVARFKSAEYESLTWTIYPELGTTIEEILVPNYWGNVSPKLKPNDFIRVFFEDGSRFAELLVISSGPTQAKVTVLRDIELDQTVRASDREDLLQGHKVVFAGPHEKWRILDADKKVVQSKFATSEEAFGWLKDHLKALAA